jgi:pilus assembly protein Flp/PilA
VDVPTFLVTRVVRELKTKIHRSEYPMKTMFARFVTDESGATAIEYGLIAAGIAVVIITAVNLVGTNLTTIFNNVANSLIPAG